MASTGDRMDKEAALRHPLVIRYFERAQEDWKRLRSTSLSPASLHEYEKSLMEALARKLQGHTEPDRA